MKIPVNKWKWYGYPGHLCVSDKCLFHLCTEVGPWLISSIGAYVPNGSDMEAIGAGEHDFYETMALSIPTIAGRCQCGCGLPDTVGEYKAVYASTARQAQANHIEFCIKYSSMQLKEKIS